LPSNKSEEDHDEQEDDLEPFWGIFSSTVL